MKEAGRPGSGPLVFTGAAFRRQLGWGKERFYAAAKAGRFAHLVAVNASSAHRVAYVRAKVEAWIDETPVSGLRRPRARTTVVKV